MHVHGLRKGTPYYFIRAVQSPQDVPRVRTTVLLRLRLIRPTRILDYYNATCITGWREA